MYLYEKTNGPKAAIYARGSTLDQNPDLQLDNLREYVDRRGFSIFKEYVDKTSGASTDRPALQELFEDVRKRKVDVVLVWRFDRFARSTKDLLLALEEFRELGIDFISYSENIDTGSPIGKVVFTLVSAIAEFERDLIRERVKAGMDRARRQEKRISRPSLPKDIQKEIHRLRKNEKLSVRRVSNRLGISIGSVIKYSS